MEGLAFSEVFARSGLENHFPAIVWVVLVQVLGIAAAPLAFVGLKALPDRGYGVAKTLGLLLLAWLTWFAASIGIMQNTRTTVALMLALVVIVGGAVFVWQRRQIVEFWRIRRRLIVIDELVFWSAFAIFLAIRMGNPDLWHPFRGGEKPMDIAFLMAAIKSVQFPPYDPWFAGGTINYYYFGQVIVATLIKLSGIVPTTAYNLAIPLLFGLTAGGVFSVAYALVASSGRAVRSGEGSGETLRGTSTRATESADVVPGSIVEAHARAPLHGVDGGAVLTALCASVFAVLLGNLGGAIQIVEQIARIGAGGKDPLSANPVISLVNGLWLIGTRAQAMNIPTDWYWHSTRVLQGTINEFPFFTFLYADLHAHMIALPFTALALAFAVHFIKGGSAGKPAFLPRAQGRFGGLSLWSLALAGLVLGSLYVTNSWDFPTYALIFGLAMLLPWYRERLHDWRYLLQRVLGGVIIVALAIGLYLPFHRSFQSYYFGAEPFPDKSDLVGFMVIHGLFIFALLSFLVGDLARHYGDSAALRIFFLALRSPGRVERMTRLHRRLVKRTGSMPAAPAGGVGVALAGVAVLLWMKLNVVALLTVILFLALLLIGKRRRSAEEMFVLGITAVGLLLGIAVEFFALKGDIGRMNTVFKFYLQVWMLWSVAGAFAVWWTFRRISRPRWPLPRRLWLGTLALLIASSAVYPLVSSRTKVADRFDNAIAPTLDGTAYMQTAVYNDQKGAMVLANDLKAIRWLQDNVPGAPTILEGQTPVYRWGSRVSIYTGLPTVLGWDWHEKQQRWGYQSMVDKRAGDVATMYNSTSPEQAIALLKQYRVSYVYVGDVERLYYPRQGVQKFEAMVGEYLDVVYDDSGVRIYKVKG